MENVRALPLSELLPSSNPRKTFDKEKLKELSASIKEKGVIEPIIVRRLKKSGAYAIVCGERRCRAAREAGLKEIPCVIMELTDEEALELQVVENLQRADLGVIEEAESFQEMIEKKEKVIGRSDALGTVACKVGKSEAYIVSRSKLLSLPPKVKLAISEDRITPGHGMVISRLNSEEEQNRLFDAIIENKMSIRVAENYLNNFGKELSRATFDTTECQSCPKNGSAQKDLFDSDTNLSGRCLNMNCYKEKTEAHFDKQYKELKDRGSKVEDEERLKGRIKGYQRYNTVALDAAVKKELGDKYKKKCLVCNHRLYVIERLNSWDKESPDVITERCLKDGCYLKLTTPPPDPLEERQRDEEAKVEREAKEEHEALQKKVIEKLDKHVILVIIADRLIEGFYGEGDEISELLEDITNKKNIEVNLELLYSLSDKDLERILSGLTRIIIANYFYDNTLPFLAQKMGIGDEVVKVKGKKG